MIRHLDGGELETPLMTLAGVNGLVVLVFSTWNPTSVMQLRTLDEWVPASGVNAVALSMDISLSDTLKTVRDMQIRRVQVVWAGPGGWNSPAARDLAVDDTSPCSYCFRPNGKLMFAGDLNEVLKTSGSMTAGTDSNSDDDDEREVSMPDHGVRQIIAQAIPRMARIGKIQNTKSLTILYQTETIRTPSEDASPRVIRRLYVAGNIFPEGEDAFEDFGTWLDQVFNHFPPLPGLAFRVVVQRNRSD